jgi:hypothetical protein
MPDIQYNTISCGPAGSFQPGDIRFAVSEEEASALVEGGYAHYIRVTVREQAVVAPVEHAVGAGNPIPVQPPERTDRPTRRGR